MNLEVGMIVKVINNEYSPKHNIALNSCVRIIGTDKAFFSGETIYKVEPLEGCFLNGMVQQAISKRCIENSLNYFFVKY